MQTAINKTRGERNNNPGNIRLSKIQWLGEVKGFDASFESFDTEVHGIRAIGVLLLNYQKKYALNSIRSLITRWAPETENNSDMYIRDVCMRVGMTPLATIDLTDPSKLVKMVTAIIFHENGRCIYAPETILEACDAALGKNKKA